MFCLTLELVSTPCHFLKTLATKVSECTLFMNTHLCSVETCRVNFIPTPTLRLSIKQRFFSYNSDNYTKASAVKAN